jgi:hypothetical protein
VLADRRAAHRQPLGQLADWRGPFVQQLEDAPADRLTEGVENRIGSVGASCLVTHGQRLL